MCHACALSAFVALCRVIVINLSFNLASMLLAYSALLKRVCGALSSSTMLDEMIGSASLCAYKEVRESEEITTPHVRGSKRYWPMAAFSAALR